MWQHIPLFEPRWYTPLFCWGVVSLGAYIYLSLIFLLLPLLPLHSINFFFFFLSRSEATTLLFLDAVTLGIRMKTTSFIIIHKIIGERNQVIHEVQFPYFSIGQARCVTHFGSELVTEARLKLRPPDSHSMSTGPPMSIGNTSPSAWFRQSWEAGVSPQAWRKDS